MLTYTTYQWAREATSVIRHWREDRQLRNKKTFSKYTIKAPEWRNESDEDVSVLGNTHGGLTALPSLPIVDAAEVAGPLGRYGSPVIAPYPVDLDGLAAQAHEVHERAVEHGECEEAPTEGEACDDNADDASIASWESLEGGPVPQLPKEQSRRNKRRARKRKERKEAPKKPEHCSSTASCAGARGPDAADTSEKDIAKKRAAEAEAVHVDYDLAGADVPYSPACFTGKPRKQHAGDKRRLVLEDVIPSMKLFNWDGRSTHPLVDSEQRFLGLLLGEMRDEDLPYIRANVTHHLHQARRYCNLSGSEEHRRGGYATTKHGVSIGGGQPRPMNMAYRNRRERRAVARLRRSLSVRRIANFGSSGLRTYVPDVYNDYSRTLDQICEEDSSLRRPFANNVFAGVTFNLGPRVVTNRHRDHLNLPFGWCCVTVFGDFDHTRGGHLVLWDLGLVIQVPSGSTFLIPSAILEHSNLDIAEGESRMSITQYSAGGLFRWIRCGSRTQAAFERDGNRLETGSTRWAAGIALLGKWAGRLSGRRV